VTELTNHSITDSRYLDAAEILERRWMLAVLSQLMLGRQHFSAMLSGIRGISDRVLTERLRDLEGRGLVTRILHTDRSVTYELTAAGWALQPVVSAVSAWAVSGVSGSRP
jgi:DNA-binding HxlR family transcriptional regulator